MRNCPLFHSAMRTLRLFAVCAVALFFLCAPAQAAGPFRVPFTYFADSQELSTVLSNFARTEGYIADFTVGVQGKVSGRFKDVSGHTFLKGMQSAFDVNWYIMGNTIHFYNSRESSRTFIAPRTCTAAEIYKVLSKSGVFSPQLPARLNETGDVISVSGPPAYLNQIRTAALAYESAQAEQVVMRVFPLKYAWAEDQTVSSMDKTVTIPGVASILSAMVSGRPISSASMVKQEKATVEKLGGKGLAALGKTPTEDQPAETNTPMTASGNVSIIADPRVNSVIVNDAAFRMPYYERVIADLDKPVELVEIHAAIVDIDTDFKRDLGISYQGNYSANRGWGGGGSVSGSPSSQGTGSTPGLIETAGASLSTIYTHGADYFLARIQALEANNEARVLGRPSVLTVDNIQATLENTTTYYVQVEGYQAVDLYKVEAGTVLRVTPHIIREHGETSIKLAVSVQDDQDDSSSYAATSSGVPPIKQTKINTQAIVNAGQSLLIGGYYYEQKGTDESGIPLLKSIPVFGNLFKATSKSSKRMERLILITPRIVRLNQGNVPSQVNEPSFHRMATQSDYEPRVPERQGGCSRKPAVSDPYANSERAM